MGDMEVGERERDGGRVGMRGRERQRRKRVGDCDVVGMRGWE